MAPACSQISHDLVEAHLALGLGAVELDHQRRSRVGGIAGVRGPLGRLDRQPVHHLDRSRDDPARDDRRHGLARVAGVLEEGDERAHRLRLRDHPQPDLRRHAERALGADERAEQVVAGPVELLAADLHELAVGQHELEPGDVVGGEAVLEAVRAAGVLGHVAADRADDLARRVGRVEVVRARPRVETSRLVTPGSTTTRWFGRSTSITRRIRESAISTPSFTGRAPPESPVPAPRATQGTPASWHARTTRSHLVGRAGQHRGRRLLRVLEQAVGLVGLQLVRVRVDVLGATDRAQLRDQRVRRRQTTIQDSKAVDCR